MEENFMLAPAKTEVLLPLEEDISPEGVEIANAYLACGGDSNIVASNLGLPLAVIVKQLNRKEVKRYIDTIFMESGYRNRHKLTAAIDNIIERKLTEMDETELGSSKDIADLLMLAHKMRMDELDKMLQLEKIHAARETAMLKETSKTTINIQDNSQFGGGNYGSLLAQLMESKC